ncbi:hypothetical protein [Paenibacillus sp. FSL H7-0331]|uniref:hypothetical protein n=1 Tax=Paenibacillus sp. FSL H7-0331 TaxID=1920421 RepID=UPI00096D56EA|nr:hypothetical protein [Paenibacillus sp. FSL H7-0331]OME97322.1 hypothetical protein BK127_40900 [Paenibacillus sp. FSL H7-0331]
MKTYVVIDSDGQHIWGSYTNKEEAIEERNKADKSANDAFSLGDVWYNIEEIDIPDENKSNVLFIEGSYEDKLYVNGEYL